MLEGPVAFLLKVQNAGSYNLHQVLDLIEMHCHQQRHSNSETCPGTGKITWHMTPLFLCTANHSYPCRMSTQKCELATSGPLSLWIWKSFVHGPSPPRCHVQRKPPASGKKFLQQPHSLSTGINKKSQVETHHSGKGPIIHNSFALSASEDDPSGKKAGERAASRCSKECPRGGTMK